MLHKEICINVHNKIVAQRKSYLLDEVESYSHGIYGLSFDSNNEIESLILLLDGPDVYSLIEEAAEKSYKDLWNHLVLYTEGWASPGTDSEQRPSEHPDAKRVRLICLVSKGDESVESIITFEKENNEPIYDTGGKGKLAESLLLIYSINNNVNFNNKQFYI